MEKGSIAVVDIKARRLLVLAVVLVVLGSSVFVVVSKADDPVANGTVRIMPLGNSITYGFPGMKVTEKTSISI